MGIMLVYDITNAKSFDNIAKWLRNIQEHANEVLDPTPTFVGCTREALLKGKDQYS
jgi:GTPase SAR1 family protein